MARPKGTSLVQDIITPDKMVEEKQEYRKLIVWKGDMKEQLEEAANKNGMTVTGFIKWCVAEKLKDM